MRVCMLLFILLPCCASSNQQLRKDIDALQQENQRQAAEIQQLEVKARKLLEESKKP